MKLSEEMDLIAAKQQKQQRSIASPKLTPSTKMQSNAKDEYCAIRFVQKHQSLSLDFEHRALHFLSTTKSTKAKATVPPQANFKYATDVLKVWYFANITNPYPNSQDKHRLCVETKLTKQQIDNWFANMRTRYWFKSNPKKPKRLAV